MGRRAIICAFGRCSVCVALCILLIVFLLSIAFVALSIPAGHAPSTIADGVTLAYGKVLSPLMTTCGEILKNFSPWGFIFLIALVVVLWGPPWIRDILTAATYEFGSFKFDPSRALGFRRGLTETARIVDRANKEITEAYEAAKAFAAKLRKDHNIDRLVSAFAVATAKEVGAKCPEDFRLTLYVPDFLFADRLFQFTEYYGRNGNEKTEGRAGRTFSERYGIIGRVWRSGVHEIEGNLLPDEDRATLPKPDDQEDVERFIARRWGLGMGEVAKVKQYPSYGAIRIESADKNIGVLYFDSKLPDAFGDRSVMDALAASLAKNLKRSELASKLLEINSETAPWSGRIQIVKNS